MKQSEVKSNISLKNYNTFGIDVNATAFIVIENTLQLFDLFKSGDFKKNHLILGGGSNVLLTKNVNGLTVKININGIDIVKEDDITVILEVGAGENWHELVLYCIEKGWGGLENLSLIPGTVGAAPMQNIGAYGVEIKDVFESLSAFDKVNGEIREFNNSDCQFDYRSSIFKTSLRDQFIITKVRFKLAKNPIVNTSYGAIKETLNSMGIENAGIREVSDAVIKIRSSKLPDPKKIGNAGSFFKNPIISINQFHVLKKQFPNIPSYPLDENFVKIPAAWLIDTAGWKGKNFKNAGVHEKQALVLVNRNQAKGDEVRELSELILKDIEERFNIQLECEVNII